MIGYLKPFTPELKLKHWEFYKSLYCSLCLHTKDQFSNFHRLFINNDSLFLYLLFISTMDKINYHFERRNCIFHPVNKTTIFIEDKYFNLFVEISFLISYVKIIDNIIDNKNIKYSIFKKLYETKISKLKIIPAYKNDFQDAIKSYFDNEKEIFSKENYKDINELTFPFVTFITSLLPLDFLPLKTSNKIKTILNHVIKIIYILDAYEDFEDDLKNNKINIINLYFSKSSLSFNDDIFINQNNYKEIKENKVNKNKINNNNRNNKINNTINTKINNDRNNKINNKKNNTGNKIVLKNTKVVDIKSKTLINEIRKELNYSFNVIKEEFNFLPIKYNKALLENFLFYSLPIKTDELIFKEKYFKNQYEKEKKYFRQIHEKW